MKVQQRDLTGASATEASRSQETQKTGREESKVTPQQPEGSGDRVELSATLGRVAKAMAAYGSERAARVQQLAAQYQAGNYIVDSLATGRGLISEALAAATR